MGEPRRTWEPGTPGILRLPSGRLVRGRAAGNTPDQPADLTLFLLGSPPPDVDHDSRWVRWRDFGLPSDRVAASAILREAWQRAASERVEVCCSGGRGRTGTALACLAVVDGVPAKEAVRYVREGYHPGAVETPWQRFYVARFTVAPGGRSVGGIDDG